MNEIGLVVGISPVVGIGLFRGNRPSCESNICNALGSSGLFVGCISKCKSFSLSLALRNE